MLVEGMNICVPWKADVAVPQEKPQVERLLGCYTIIPSHSRKKKKRKEKSLPRSDVNFSTLSVLLDNYQLC